MEDYFSIVDLLYAISSILSIGSYQCPAEEQRQEPMMPQLAKRVNKGSG